MRVICGDLWQREERKVIPTNLSRTHAGLAIMGRGVAKQASLKYSALRVAYGGFLLTVDQPCLFYYAGQLICFPVKYGWDQEADLGLIEKSAQLLARAEGRIALPLLGCGFGTLDPLDVLPILARYLTDDRFTLVLRDLEATARHADTLKPGARRDKTVRT